MLVVCARCSKEFERVPFVVKRETAIRLLAAKSRWNECARVARNRMWPLLLTETTPGFAPNLVQNRERGAISMAKMVQQKGNQLGSRD